MIYYVYLEGEQRGPFQLDQLKELGITRETMVWREDQPEWVPAWKLAEVLSVIERPEYNHSQPGPSPSYAPGQPEGYDQPAGYGHQQPGYGNPYNYGRYYGNQAPMRGAYPPGWTNWMGWAIAATIICVFGGIILSIPGIIGIVKSNQANTMARMGLPEAYSVNATAKVWTIIGLVLSALGILAAIFFFLIFFGALVASSGYNY